MPSFRYRVIHQDGTVEKLESEADSAEQLFRESEAQGSFIEQVVEIKSHSWRPIRRKMVGSKQVYLLVHEFIALLKAGVTIPESLHYLANRPSQPHLSKVLKEIQQKVMHGRSLSSSMDSYPDVFDKMFINSVMIGEKNGQLVNSLDNYLSYLKIEIAIKQKVRAAMVYPIFLSVILVIAVSILFFFVMPRFAKMYAEFDAELPYPTQVLMSIVERSDVIFPAMVVLSLLSLAIAKYWFSYGNGKKLIDKFVLSAPVIRDVTIPFNISSNSSALATLVSAGMPLVDALKATAKSSSNTYIAEKLEHASQKMTEGSGFADTLKKYEIVDESALTMIRAGEKSGQLTSILREVSNFNSERLDDAVSRHLALIEPLIMLIMGLVLGGVIFVMYLPIFTIAEVIK